MQVGGFRTAIDDRDHHVDVLDILLGVLHGDLEEPVAFEDSGVLDLVFRLVAPTP